MSTTPTHDDVIPDELRSTWPHRAWTLAGSLAILSTFLTTARLVAASGSPAAELLAVAVAAAAAGLLPRRPRHGVLPLAHRQLRRRRHPRPRTPDRRVP
ncbi:unnamed protein product [Urochloa humidicola]